MPASRSVLYTCFGLLALLALWRFDLLLLVPCTVVLGVQFKDSTKNTVFGRRRPDAPAGQPRDTGDPLVRAYLVVGGFLLIAGLVRFFWFPIASAPGLHWAALPGWLFRSGTQALLLGSVFIALGFDLLQGGLGRRPPAPPAVADDREPAEPVGHVLGLTVAPWLALAALAYLGKWNALGQALVMVIGLSLIGRLAKRWPLFAALGAPAIAFYGWNAMGHTGRPAEAGNPLGFVVLICLASGAFGLVMSTLGRAVTGVLDATVRKTRVPAPWLTQAVLGLALCALVASAQTQLKARTARIKEAEVAAREARLAAAERKAAAQRAEAQAEADARRAEADALVPGVSCHYDSARRQVVFENQQVNPKPGIAGARHIQRISLTPEPHDTPRQTRALDTAVDLKALRQHVRAAPILQLPSGDIVSMSPAGAQLLMLAPDGRLFHLASFHEPLLKHATVACASDGGSNWTVALGPVAILFERGAPDAPPRELRQYVLDAAWFP